MMSRIALDGREYTLRYTVNALCCLEDQADGSLEKLLGKGISGLRGLLWCGLMEEDPSLTLAKTGELLQRHLQSGGSLQSVALQVASALEDAGFFQQPVMEKEKEA